MFLSQSQPTDLDLADRLTSWVTTFEDVLHIVSGPFLAAGALIATAYVFTDGSVGKGGIGVALLIGWAITQAVGLDFQVLSLGYRSINAARNRKWGAFSAMVFLALVLGFVGVQTHAVFGFVSSNSSNIPTAMQSMGIDQHFLLWERAALSFLLTFIAGAMRPAKKVKSTPAVEDKTVQELLQKVHDLGDLIEDSNKTRTAEVEKLHTLIEDTQAAVHTQSTQVADQLHRQEAVELHYHQLAEVHREQEEHLEQVHREISEVMAEVHRQSTHPTPLPATQEVHRQSTQVKKPAPRTTRPLGKERNTDPEAPIVLPQDGGKAQMVKDYVREYMAQHGGKRPSISLIVDSVKVSNKTAIRYRDEVEYTPSDPEYTPSTPLAIVK